MYAFRKRFSVATLAVVPGWTFALDYKIALVIAQVIGYATWKLIGIKVISELQPVKRAPAIVALNLLAWLALLLFALIPAPWNVAAMFLNGLPPPPWPTSNATCSCPGTTPLPKGMYGLRRPYGSSRSVFASTTCART